jgi:hypothetical protein
VNNIILIYMTFHNKYHRRQEEAKQNYDQVNKKYLGLAGHVGLTSMLCVYIDIVLSLTTSSYNLP